MCGRARRAHREGSGAGRCPVRLLCYHFIFRGNLQSGRLSVTPPESPPLSALGLREAVGQVCPWFGGEKSPASLCGLSGQGKARPLGGPGAPLCFKRRLVERQTSWRNLATWGGERAPACTVHLGVCARPVGVRPIWVCVGGWVPLIPTWSQP